MAWASSVLSLARQKGLARSSNVRNARVRPVKSARIIPYGMNE